MFAAMSSRAPVGGVPAPYEQVITAGAKSRWEGPDDGKVGSGHDTTWEEFRGQLVVTNGDEDHVLQEIHLLKVWECLHIAEEALTQYPLHPRVQEFFDKFVGAYGHSSVLELTGSPTVYVGGLSYWGAYLLFDNPLVCGQEFSTRAVAHKEWPMAMETCLSPEDAYHMLFDTEVSWEDFVSGNKAPTTLHMEEWTDPDKRSVWMEKLSTTPHPELEAINNLGMEIFLAEVGAWKKELRLPCPDCEGHGYHVTPGEDPVSVEQLEQAEASGLRGINWCSGCERTGRKYPWIKDPQAFRPALDRARWALPGTISTGCGFGSHIRERARAMRDGAAFAQGSDTATQLFSLIRGCYREAAPGIGALGLREAVYKSTEQTLPKHLGDITKSFVNPFPVRVKGVKVEADLRGRTGGPEREKVKTYADAYWNKARVDFTIQCSLAVARDWHRHRSCYPWSMKIVSRQGHLMLAPYYKPMSPIGRARYREYFALCRRTFDKFVQAGDSYRAMLSLPFGTTVHMSASAGLRDFLYTMELRAYAHGANFEYEEQASLALAQLQGQLEIELGQIDRILKVSAPAR